MTPVRISAISAVLTARAVCIGSERGTTDVTMRTQRSNSSCVVLSPFSTPRLKTAAEAKMAKMSSTSSAMPVSLESSLTFC